MNKLALTTSLASVLLTAACQHNPVSRAGEQHSLEETAVEVPAIDTLESRAQVAPQIFSPYSDDNSNHYTRSATADSF